MGRTSSAGPASTSSRLLTKARTTPPSSRCRPMLCKNDGDASTVEPSATTTTRHWARLPPPLLRCATLAATAISVVRTLASRQPSGTCRNTAANPRRWARTPAPPTLAPTAAAAAGRGASFGNADMFLETAMRRSAQTPCLAGGAAGNSRKPQNLELENRAHGAIESPP
jgi:hypothetical protein